MINKPLAAITLNDIQSLCREGRAESERLDFKSGIPHKEGLGQDPWEIRREIKERGRNELLATVVAFANSYGGDLVIGVDEKEHARPGVAERLTPLADAREAAHRLAQMAMATIDPPLADFPYVVIDTEGGARGVIVIRIAKSHAAPHRLSTNKDCYWRVRDQTLAMSMRQIQDLTFRAARGTHAIEQIFSDSRSEFIEWAAVPDVLPPDRRRAIRVTAVPLDPDFYLPEVHDIEGLQPLARNWNVVLGGQRLSFRFPFEVASWRPTLRGTEAHENVDSVRGHVRLRCNGTLTYWYRLDVRNTIANGSGSPGRDTYTLHPAELFAIVINAVESMDRLRLYASISAVEFGVSIGLAYSRDVPVYDLSSRYAAVAGNFRRQHQDFPTYVFGQRESWNETYSLMWRDFWEAIGCRALEKLTVASS